jgi:small-conductance mechanosensitive channel
LIINRVENFTLMDSKTSQTSLVSVAYDSDVDLVRQLLIKACESQERVLQDPAPNAFLSQFGADGLEFTVSYWIADPENGQLALRSSINMMILASLREHKIEIPYPQRVMHMVNASPNTAPD